MKQVIEFITNINVCYLVLNILMLIDVYLYLKQEDITKAKRRILLFVCFVTSLVVFPYFNGMVHAFFGLDYLAVKSYLLVLILTNIITLITINKRLKIGFEILNYTLFIIMAIIFISVVVIILGDKIPKIYLMDIYNVVTLIDLSIVIFIIYLIGISIVYIGYYIFDGYNIGDMVSGLVRKVTGIIDRKIKNKVVEKETVLLFDENDNNDISTSDINVKIVLSPEELLEYEDKDNFYINGVECSIIFEDSIEENIIKNYYILLDDIDAPMANGFTLNENKLLKSICMKLQVMDLENIDLDSSIVLNSINDEEYNFLKNICGE